MKFYKSFMAAYLRYFLIGLAVLVAIETGVLIYINNVYLRDNSKYNVKTIANSSISKLQLKTVSVAADAKNAVCSSERHYVAYLSEGAIVVSDMTNGKKYTVQSSSGMQVSFFKWIYNSDRLIVAEKSTSGEDDFIKLYYYDMKDKTLTEIRNNTNDKDIAVALQSASDSVTGIDMSTQTVKTYVKITSGSGKSRIWEVDAYGTGLTRLSSTITSYIGNIQSLKWRDKLLYEDKSNGKIYMYGSKSAISPVTGTTSLALLGFDNSGNVYLANTAGGRTKTVYCGNYNGDKWDWKTVSLVNSEDHANLYVTLNGGIYYNNTDRSEVVKLWPAGETPSSASSSSSKSAVSKSSDSSSGTDVKGIPYQGKIVGICEGGFLTIFKGTIKPYDFS